MCRLWVALVTGTRTGANPPPKGKVGNLVFSQVVTVDDAGKDRYGRTIGRVHLGDLDVNAAMVRTGYAWVYRQYAKDKSLYALEDEARTAGLSRRLHSPAPVAT